MKTNRLRTALMGSGAAIAMIAASGSAGADELQDLKTQIEALQSKVSELEAQNAGQGSPNVAPAAAVEAGDKPKSWKLPGTNTSMNIGGYAKLDFIYDLNERPAFHPDLANFGRSTPSPGAGQIQNQFRAHARQSRIWFKTWTPTDWGELATHIEGDFFGTGGNERISNSTSFRLRHAYGRLGPVLAGQTWTNFMDLRSFPEVVDFFGPTGEPFIRQAQIRYTHDFGGGTSLAVSVENPSNTDTLADVRLPATALVTEGGDRVPDFTARLTHAHSSGHVALSGVVRYLTVANGGGGSANVSESTVGWGIAPSFSQKLTSTDTIGGLAHYGQGSGRYLIASVFNGAILTGNPAGSAGGANFDLEAIETWGGFGWWRHQWTDTIRTNLVGGFTQINTEDEVGKAGLGIVPGAVASLTNMDREYSVHANIIWSPVPQVNIGLEYIYKNTSFHNLDNGETSRFHLGFQYSF